MNIKIHKRECGAKKIFKYYLYDIDSKMCWNGKFWTGSIKNPRLFDLKKEAIAEKERQFARLIKLILVRLDN